jgi:predicted transcriptional regulator
MARTTLKKLISFRTTQKRHAALAKLTKATGRSRSELINDALDAYLDAQAWQVARIKTAAEKADEGKFATEKKMRAEFDKWRS